MHFRLATLGEMYRGSGRSRELPPSKQRTPEALNFSSFIFSQGSRARVSRRIDSECVNIYYCTEIQTLNIQCINLQKYLESLAFVFAFVKRRSLSHATLARIYFAYYSYLDARTKLTRFGCPSSASILCLTFVDV